MTGERDAAGRKHPVIPGSHKPGRSPKGLRRCSHPLCGSCAVRAPGWAPLHSRRHRGKAAQKTVPHVWLNAAADIPKRPAVPGERRWLAACLISGDNRQRWASGRNAVPGVHAGSDAPAQGCAAPSPPALPGCPHTPRSPLSPPGRAALGQAPPCSHAPGSALQPLCAEERFAGAPFPNVHGVTKHRRR